MKINEITEDDGSLSAVELVVAGEGGLAIRRGAGEPLPLPEGALAAVMQRYGNEFDPDARVTDIETLRFGDETLRHVRHHDVYDVIARDWLVYEGRAAIAQIVSGVLEHLAKAAAGTATR